MVDMEYDYRRYEFSLLRAPLGKAWKREVYRPVEDKWVQYELAGAAENWHEGVVVEPAMVEGMKLSLREHESGHTASS